MGSMTAELVGDDLRRARKMAGMTQAELGALLGVTGSAVGQWEAGTTKPQWKQAQRLAQVLAGEPVSRPSTPEPLEARVAVLERELAQVWEVLRLAVSVQSIATASTAQSDEAAQEGQQ